MMNEDSEGGSYGDSWGHRYGKGVGTMISVERLRSWRSGDSVPPDSVTAKRMGFDPVRPGEWNIPDWITSPAWKG